MRMLKFKDEEGSVITSGIVTLVNWTMMPDGNTYIYVWCRHWEVVTDKMMPLDNFRSSEHWQLAGLVNGNIMLFLPGCQVKAWAYSENKPKSPNCYELKL
ncbi:hypothetical protein LCGC14_0609150 [marine sediment metagenome]|uniref:Uncharacterized protein n=1 Tax=marine sediment metagenome TaxID=412755 RepID=A0A0F9RSJ0_9ZZZZ